MKDPSDELRRRPPSGGGTPAPGSGSGRRPTLGLPASQAPGMTPAPAVPGPGLQPGTMLGKYQIVRQLGEGGMGAVYEAIHTGIGKPVALKTMNPALAADPRFSTRFSREAALASRLDHPHVVAVTDFGTDAGVSYLVMELLRGEDLATMVAGAGGRLEPALVADIMLPVCAGVFAAHEAGVVHRDLKPQNVFVARTPLGEMVPKVLDFGISKIVDKDGAPGGLTTTGGVVGTMHYMSPEQVTGKNVDGRSDQYALGVILYECLTGRRPHEGDTIFLVMRSIGEGTFEPPSTYRPDLAPEMEQIILRAMGLRPQDRFESVHAMGRALLPFASSRGQVLWSDYYDRERPPVSAASSGSAGYPPVRATRPLDLGAQGEDEVVPVAARRVRGPASQTEVSPSRARSLDSRSGVAPVAVANTTETFHRGSRRWGPIAVGLGVVGAAAVAWLVLGNPAPERASVEPAALRPSEESTVRRSSGVAPPRPVEEEGRAGIADPAPPPKAAEADEATEPAGHARNVRTQAQPDEGEPRAEAARGERKKRHAEHVDRGEGHKPRPPKAEQPHVIYNPAGAPILE